MSRLRYLGVPLTTLGLRRLNVGRGMPGPTLLFRLDNMGNVTGSGDMSNGRTSTAYIQEYDGALTPTLANEIRYARGRRVDHADATMYNAGVLGIEYLDTESDGTTLISPPPAMLHERAGTNNFFHSNDISNAAWNKTGLDTVVANELVPTVASSNNFFNKDLTVLGSTRYTQTYYVKPNGYNYLQITGSLGFSSGNLINYELTGAGTITWKPLPATGASIELLDNGWYKIIASMDTLGPGTARMLVSVLPSDIQSRLPNVVGDGSGIFCNYCQTEQSPYSSSYMASGSSNGTRTIDTIQNDAIANWDNTKGIAFLEFTPLYDSDTTAMGLFNTTNAVAGVFSDSATAGTVSSEDGTNTASTNLTSWVAGDTVKLALVFDSVAGSMEIASQKNAGAWSSWVSSSYDGAFPLSTDLHWMFGLTETAEIIDTRIYNTLYNETIAASKTWVEANL